MASTNDTKPLDELIEEKTEKFESGTEREHDEDLDEMIWELGDYESQEPPQEAQEFKEAAPVEEDLTEKEMRISGKKVYFREPEQVGDKTPLEGKLVEIKNLKIVIEGGDCEIVCGRITAGWKEKLERYCRENDLTPADAWYEDRMMKSIIGRNWKGWYNVDEFLHELGLYGGDVQSFLMAVSIDEEPLERLDRGAVKVHFEPVPKPVAQKGYVTVVAGLLNESRHIFQLDVAGDFEPQKLSFHFKDLNEIGLAKSLLTEIRYGDQVMNYVHQDYGNEDVLDVIFLG